MSLLSKNGHFPSQDEIHSILEVARGRVPQSMKDFPPEAKKYAAQYKQFLDAKGSMDKPVPDKRLDKDLVKEIEMLLHNESVESINEASESPWDTLGMYINDKKISSSKRKIALQIKKILPEKGDNFKIWKAVNGKDNYFCRIHLKNHMISIEQLKKLVNVSGIRYIDTNNVIANSIKIGF